ncbi:MAG: hypothetical protein GX115_07920, partial [Ruminiclostridium sp.]|nr:hypothetical protein [Ruminiclostridium sp.]
MLAPTLIVGLGGTGSRIVANVQKKATEIQRKNIGFVVLDTDANELRVLQEKGFTGTFIQTSSKLTVGEYLNIDRDARDNWFPVNEILNRKTVSEGAGQIRAISRLAMNTTIRSGALDGLHKAIDNLYRLTGDDMKQALRVIIVSTLAGGTGSGILLPLAMYIRNYLVSRYQQNASIMRGFFLLPEIFFDVITTRSEQNNLMCNAYATLRELDAFLMKGDGTLPAQYRPVLQMPNPGMEGSTEYDVMPFDFCFLFDAQNMDGSKLNSLGDYLEHAANCIYSQSVSPMQARSYSSEDNVIRELCKDGGRNRYCGTGTSMLIYPFDDVREYVALNWAKTGTSKDWIAIDEQYKAEQAEYKKALSQGANLPKTEKDRHYIQNIHTSVTEKNPFALYIKNQCYEMGENGIVTDIPKWESYITALEGFVSKNATEGQTRENTAEMDSEPDSAVEAEKGANQTDVFMNILQKLRTYNKLAVKATEESARSIAYTLFYSDMGLKSGKEEHKLEYWLKNETGEMIHPNSARFFLYNLLPILKENRNMYHNAVQRAETSWNSFERGFDDPNTENVIESAETRIHKDIKKGSNAIALYLNNDKREEILEKFRAFHSTTKDYRVKAVLCEVYSTAIVYVQSLIESYEHFFVALAQNVKKLDGRIEQIYHKYNQSKGIATRYVCANSQCLDAMEHQLMYPGNAFDVPGRLCTGIYQQVKEQVMSTKKGIKVGNNYYDELFNTVIICYWKDAVMSYYGSNVDMDVVQALYKEAEIMAGAVTPQAQQRYMLDVMDECRRLSRPFIESPRGEQPREIPTCTFHKSVRESVPTQLQGKVFLNGVDNEDIAKSMMIFYSAIYGIR